MNTPSNKHRTHGPYLKVIVTLEWLAVIAFLTLLSLGAMADDSRTPFWRKTRPLSVMIPLENKNDRGLMVELLDAGDAVLARQTLSASQRSPGGWTARLNIPAALRRDDLSWHRLRMTYLGSDSERSRIKPVSDFLPLPQLRIIGQNEWAAGSPAVLRIVALDSVRGTPIPDAEVRLTVMAGEKGLVDQHYTTDANGTLEPVVKLPDGFSGTAELRVVLETGFDVTEAKERIEVAPRVNILLTTDKPIYQPGHRVFIRSLALDRISRAAAAHRSITLEIEDARGNKVFKQRGMTDEFGVASAEFQLAEEVNLGEFKLRAILGDSGSRTGSETEKNFKVARYVLPKFKIAIEWDGGKLKSGKPEKKFYLPGEAVVGTLNARYLFGKPVSGGKVKIRLNTFDVGTAEIGAQSLTTDTAGKARFHLKLPAVLAGMPLDQGAAPVAFIAEVTDTADHTESHPESLLVSAHPLLIVAVPEAGEIVPGMDNRVYLRTTDPAGAAVKSRVTGNFAGGEVLTDDEGFATVMRPHDDLSPLALHAEDSRGRTGKTTITLNRRVNADDNLMIRTERTVYRVGEAVSVAVFSTRKRGAVYVDVIKERQTLLTRAIDLDNGIATLLLPLAGNLEGTLEVRAYQFGRNADPVGDRRLILVEPADGLRIETRLSKNGYRPGEVAQMNVQVRDSAGLPQRAILDVAVVDEAVFALTERQPGFEKVFQLLEKELLQPRYEIHGLEATQLFHSESAVHPKDDALREQSAKLLFAAAQTVEPFSLKRRIVNAVTSGKSDRYLPQYQKLTELKIRTLLGAMNRYYAATQSDGRDFNRDIVSAVRERYVTPEQALDPWDRPFRFTEAGWGAEDYRIWEMTIPLPPSPYHQLSVPIIMLNLPRHKPAPANNSRVPRQDGSIPFIFRPRLGLLVDQRFKGSRPQIIPTPGVTALRGRVTDDKGAPLPGAIIKAKGPQGIKAAETDGKGNYNISFLTPGMYEVTASMDQFGSVVQSGVEIMAHHTTQQPFKMASGSGGTIIVVRSSVSVDTTSTTATTRINLTSAIESFTRDRSLTSAFDFSPGAVAKSGVSGGNPSISGASGLENQYLIGGVNITSSGYGAIGGPSSGEKPPRLRNYFPETLYVNPALITDGEGNATLRIPLADSITTWRMSLLASTTQGRMGSATAAIPVFQEFFIDLDMPVALTRNDVVTVPVAVYNYLHSAQTVAVTLKPDSWFELVNDQPVKSLTVAADEVGSVSFRLRANRIGRQMLMVTGRLTDRSAGTNGDAVAREIEVIPDGEMKNLVINDRLEKAATQEINFPANALPDASKILVKFYPGPLSQAVEGLDSILRMPGGCFEQTSSSTYPNVLVMDYMKTTKKITPEIQAKAEGYISLGYQKLVTFEVPGGGFSWFGQAPANKILTGYGLMEFADMAKVHEVDPRLIQRTQQWLVSQQQSDGGWIADKEFINEGATNNFNTDRVRIAGYIGWSLAASGYQGPAVAKAKQFIEAHLTGKEDAYTLAVLANFAVDGKLDASFTSKMIDNLARAATDDGKTVFWRAEGQTPTYARGDSAAIETTGLASQALIKSGRQSNLATKALAFLTSKKDAFGNWNTTQATIHSLRAFLLAQQHGPSADTRGTIRVTLNGKPAGEIEITADNAELMHQLDLKEKTGPGHNIITMQFAGKGSLLYQIIGRHYLPWHPAGAANEPLSIAVAYDRTQLMQNDITTATVTIRNNQRQNADMVMIDLGIPPGFELLGEDLQEQLNNGSGRLGHLTKFTTTAKQAILYFDGISPAQSLTLKYRLRAKYPIRAKSFASKVYEYYNPEVNATAPPQDITVTPIPSRR